MREMPTDGQHESGRYEIRLKGHLGSRWVARFDGLNLTTVSDGTTLIHGPAMDQAALHGILQTVRDLGLPLISIIQVDAGPHPGLDNSSRSTNPDDTPDFGD